VSTTKDGACTSCLFAPLENNFLKVDFDLPRAAAVTVTIRNFFSLAEVMKLFDSRLYGRGTHTVYWEGTTPNGNFLTPPPGRQFLWTMLSYPIPDNAVIVDRGAEITDLTVTPNFFDPSTGDFLSPQNPRAQLTYTLTADAVMSVQVFRAGTNRLIRTLFKGPTPAGVQNIDWDGRTEDGKFVDTGIYRISVQAIDVDGNSSLVRYGLVKVFY
jgi:flagellar hook assembly protein FlgD